MCMEIIVSSEKSILHAFEDISLSNHSEVVYKESIIIHQKVPKIASCRSTHLVGHVAFNFLFLKMEKFVQQNFANHPVF
jgi:hypothetical protein